MVHATSAPDLLAQGQRLWRKDQFAPALICAQQAIAQGLRNQSSLALMGDCHRSLQQPAEALAAYAQALEFAPDHAYLRFLCGEALDQLGHQAEALVVLSEIDPGSDPVLQLELAMKLGRVQQQMGMTEQAEMNLLKAFLQAPHSEDAACNLVAFYDLEGQPEQALQILQAATRNHPQSTRLHYNLGTHLAERGDSPGATAALHTTLRHAPGHIQAHQNLALTCLRQGQLAEGWQHYAWRVHRHAHEGGQAHWTPQTTALPRDLHGRTVEVLGEQGLGDELFFMRWLPALRARGACVRYTTHSVKLHPLLQTLQQRGLLVHSGAPADYRLLVGDLPLMLGEYGTPPPLTLAPDPACIAHWKTSEPVLRGSRPRLGLTWRAGTQTDYAVTERQRWLSKEVPLQPLLDLLAPLPVDIVILQRQPRPEERTQLLERLGPARCLDASAHDQDLVQLLGLLDCLDGMVGVSNTNMHLLAGLGKTADVLVPLPAEFRWQDGPGDSPWFPGFRVYRQTPPGDWQPPLEALAEILQSRY